MGLHKHTTIITTKGVKTLQELDNVPFDVILDGQTFRCPHGTFIDGHKDIYEMRTTQGFRIYTSHDQLFYTEAGEFLTLFELENLEETTYIKLSNPEHLFKTKINQSELSLGAASSGVDAMYLTQSYSFYVGFFQALWERIGRWQYNSGLPGFIYPEDAMPYDEFCLIQKMLLRCGVMSRSMFQSKKIYRLRGLVLRGASVATYHDMLGLPDSPETTFILEKILERNRHVFFNTKFQSAQYHSTDDTYSCVVDHAACFEADGFYVADYSLH